MAEPTKEDVKIAEGLSKLYLEASAEQLDLTRRIASAIAAEREKAAKIAEAHYANHNAKNETGIVHIGQCHEAIAAAIRAGDK